MSFSREVFDLTLSSVNDDEAMILRLPRLLRLLRISQAFRYLYRWGELLPVSMYQLRMLKLGFGILLFVHVNASLHLVAGILNRDNPLGWMSRTGALWDSHAHKVVRRAAHHHHAKCTFLDTPVHMLSPAEGSTHHYEHDHVHSICMRCFVQHPT